MRILLVEDNSLTASGLRFLLEHEGFEVVVALTAASALDQFSEHLYDLAILDVNLPDKDGFSVASELRKIIKDIPVIFLTARDDEESVIEGFNLNADDYITKPFRNRELITRINAVLRRRGLSADQIKCGKLALDEKANVVRKNNKEITLSSLEYKILRVLMLNAGSIVKRERLIDEIWDFAGNIVNDNTLTVYIKRIREKVGDDSIKTIKGIGYKMESR